MTTRMKITHALAVLYAVTLLFLFPCIPSAAPDSSGLSSVSVVPFGKIPYVSLVELAEALNLKIVHDPLMNSMTVQRGSDELTLHNFSRFAQYNGSLENLMVPAKLFKGSIYAPATCLPLLSRFVQGSLTLDTTEWKVSSSELIGSVKSITFDERIQGTLIRLGFTEPLECIDVINTVNDRTWLHIRVKDGIYFSGSSAVALPVGMVKSVKTITRDGELLLSFLVSDDMESYDIKPAADSNELLISLRRKRSAQTKLALGTLQNNGRENNHVNPTINNNYWVIDTIVVDPGHGGKDPGAVGQKGTKEKDIVLAISQELKKIADERGEIKTVLTRSKDEFLSLRKRANVAIENHGKLFISIHANSLRNKRVSGVEVYFLSAAKEESAKRVAERENASIHFEENPAFYTSYDQMFDNKNISKELMEIQGDMASNVFLSESQDMCSILLDSVVSSSRQSSRGVKQAGFYVMLGTQASMPSVLFEVGFLSNAKEEKLLRRASHRKRIAHAIYDSVITFKKMAERDLFSMSGSQ